MDLVLHPEQRILKKKVNDKQITFNTITNTTVVQVLTLYVFFYTILGVYGEFVCAMDQKYSAIALIMKG